MKSNWEHSHTGVAVRDFAGTLRYYRALGLAPDQGPRQRPARGAGDVMVNIEFGQVMDNYAGRPANEPFLELLYIGDLELEVLHAPATRPTGEALIMAEGVNHVCFNVPDIDGETDVLVKKGLRIIQDAKLNGVRIEDYLDTRQRGNILLSLRPRQSEADKARKAGYGIIDWKYEGVGALVKDLAKTAAYYRSMDIASFKPQGLFDSGSIGNLKVNGRTARGVIQAKTRLMQIDSVDYELIEPLEGGGLFKDSLARRGEGIINLTFSVSDLEKETASLVGKGVSVAMSGEPRNGRAFAYFDTRKDGGDVMMKLVQR